MANEPSGRAFPATRLVVGLLIIAWGLVLTAGNFGWFPWSLAVKVVRLWPLLIVAFGVGKLLSADCASGKVFGGALVGVGLLLTAQRVFWLPIHFWQWWPLVLVVVGAMMVARAWEARGQPGPRPRDARSEVAFLSGIERRIALPDYRGSNLTVLMGGIELDLRGSTTVTGEAVLDVFILMGGLEITVPPDWVVVNQVTPILGGVEDKSTGGAGAQHRLIVRGTVIIGGVNIKT